MKHARVHNMATLTAASLAWQLIHAYIVQHAAPHHRETLALAWLRLILSTLQKQVARFTGLHSKTCMAALVV